MQIERPATTNEKNLTTDVNLEFIIKTSSKADVLLLLCTARILKAREGVDISRESHSQTSNLIRRAFFKSNRRQIIMKSERFKNSAVLLLAALVAGCSQIAVVSEKRPVRFQATPGTNQAIAQTIDRAQALDRSQPQAALEAYVNAARDSLHGLDRHPADTEARRCYNFAVAGIFSVIRKAKLDPWTQPVHVGANSGLTLIGRNDPSKPEQNPALYDLIPTDELRYHGTYVKEDVRQDGIGAPLVAVRHVTAEKAAEFFIPPAIYYGVKGVADFEGSRCFISIKDPLAWAMVDG